MKIVQDRKAQFAEIVTMIQHTRSEVVQLANVSLIEELASISPTKFQFQNGVMVWLSN